MAMDTDLKIRLAAFQWLEEQTSLHGDVLPRDMLAEGFSFEGQRVPLVSPKGIFKPRLMQYPLSITSVPNTPFENTLSEAGFLLYKYKAEDRFRWDIAALRDIFCQELPLVYLHGIIPGEYLAVWPAYVIDDDPKQLAFKIVIDDYARVGIDTGDIAADKQVAEARREYITTTFRMRLHQRSFREKVLEAYTSRCAFCQLRHRELLDAAHIIPEHLPESRSGVDNGLALCKLHHAAYDNFLLGVDMDYHIQVREDILEEQDGPLLQVGLQALHDQKIILPADEKNWPAQDALAWRYERFLIATR
jgi:putative restriction endonuclease